METATAFDRKSAKAQKSEWGDHEFPVGCVVAPEGGQYLMPLVLPEAGGHPIKVNRNDAKRRYDRKARSGCSYLVFLPVLC